VKNKTAGIAWKDSFKIGFEQVDSQHRQLFELLNKLVLFCEKGSDIKNLQKTMDFLVNYAFQHFHDEESVQIQYNYPEYREHKLMHDNFKTTIEELISRFKENGSSEELSKDVNRIVVRWVINHIQNEDVKIGVHVRKMTSRFDYK